MFKKIVSGISAGAAICALASMVDCLERPVVATKPITRANFTQQVQQSAVDKVDLLFDIDNSASMGDKQAYLMLAIPDLIGRLIQPRCLDANGAPVGTADLNGECPAGQNAEFSPVHNMHVGIVSSSLGARLGDTCPTTAGIPVTDTKAENWVFAWQALPSGGAIDRHNDDQGHLLNRGSNPKNLSDYTETPLGIAQDNTAGQGDFLDWFPTSNMNNLTSTATGPMPIGVASDLTSDFQQLVVGVHQFGCGIESQLETWYRFLVQPDPYDSLTTVSSANGQVARWNGVDKTILAQRADFLRPDSLVAIIVLTDENDSEVDVRSFGGSGYQFMNSGFPPPKATSACAVANGENHTGLTDPKCTFCGQGSSDPTCFAPDGGGVETWPLDNVQPNWGGDMNLRHVHEKLKYGAEVQFPIQRYLIGLTSTRVPNRDGEYPPDGHGGEASSYQGLNEANLNCTNPLFAKQLPAPPNNDLGHWNPQWTSGNVPADSNDDLCNLEVGTRPPNLVFYAHIGGVPHQLLQNDPTKTDLQSQSQKDTLTDADWKLILGNDPLHYDYTGIDPHMIEDYKPRTGYPTPPGGFPVSSETSTGNPDPISGREWITDSTNPRHAALPVDVEYACTFPLTDPNTGKATSRDCSPNAVSTDPTLEESCDCLTPATGSLSPSALPSVCNAAHPTEQDFAKAYPTIRELLLANLMGKQGIISSLCPIHTTDQSPDGKSDPLYGYRPAMNAIVNRLIGDLGLTCLPEPLNVTTDPVTKQKSVNCLVLGTFPSQTALKSCADVPGGGWLAPDPDILQGFKSDQKAEWVALGNPNSVDPADELTCELRQLPVDVRCDVRGAAAEGGSSDGWCYVEHPNASCGQTIFFSPNSQILGVVTHLQCLEQLNGDE